jgi:phenylacetyl-CoA:acceptor oxidoreductase subunit 2
VSYGPDPWQQTQWDWRAAANFICGGAGSGLLVFAALSGAAGAAPAPMLLAGMALVGVGLLCVWLEIGRPWRALHVFFNPRTSWMTREGAVATLLMPAALAAVFGVPGSIWLAAVLALAFVYCQGRILRAAKGIPAWRDPLIVALIVTTGLAEGGGLWLLAQGGTALEQPLLLLAVAMPLLARALLWPVYRSRLAAHAAPRALAALDHAGRWWLAGSYLPLAALAAVASAPLAAAPATALLAVLGALIVAAGAWFKFTLITRAGFNQGFALKHLPVRGVRR